MPKQPYIYIYIFFFKKKLSNTANPAGDTIFQWDPIVYLDWKSLSAKGYRWRILFTIPTWVIWVNTCSNTPQKNITTTILLVISPLSIHRSIYLHCIHSIPLQHPNQIRPYFKFLKRIPCGFNPSGKYARQWAILFHIWFNITAFFEWSAILCYSNTQLYILPDIHSDSSSGIFIWHFICIFFGHLIWHSIYHVSDILSGIRHSISQYRYVIAHSGIFSARNRRWRCLVKISGSPGKGQRTYTFFAKNQIIGDQESSSSPHFMDILW